jgi:hypothetical protein
MISKDSESRFFDKLYNPFKVWEKYIFSKNSPLINP